MAILMKTLKLFQKTLELIISNMKLPCILAVLKKWGQYYIMWVSFLLGSGILLEDFYF